MEIYDKKPGHFGRRFIAVLGAGVVAFGTPFAINAALPEWTPNDEQVTLADSAPPAADEEAAFTGDIDEVDVDGLQCPTDPMAMGDAGWTCGEASVSTRVIGGVDDPATTAKREVRNAAMSGLGEVDNAVTANDGHGTWISADPDVNAVGIVHQLNDELYSITSVTGVRDDACDATAKVWQSLTDTELPPEIQQVVDDFSTEPLTGLVDDITGDAGQEGDVTNG